MYGIGQQGGDVLGFQTMTNSVNDGMIGFFFCVPIIKENGLKRNYELLTDRVHDKGLLINMMKRY